MEDPRVARASARVAAAATLFYALVSLWELWGPLPGGHLGNGAAAAMAGENMVRHRVLAAVLEPTVGAPTPAQLYTHHPYGTFFAGAVGYLVAGHGWVATKLPAAALSAATPWLLFAFARALWGPLAGAVTAVVFVTVPINLAFASYLNLEVPLLFSGALFSWAATRFFQTHRTRFILASAVGAWLTCQADWIGMVLVGGVGASAFLRAYALPERWSLRIDHRQHARWFGWVTAAALVTLLMYLGLFAKAGRLGDLAASAELRSHGASAPLGQVFGPRRTMWLLWMLPAPALLGVAAGAALSSLRITRSFSEIVPVWWLAAASLQYFGFRQGADVHVYWPHMYSVCAALGWGVFAAGVGDAAVSLRAPRLGVALAAGPPLVAALLSLRVGLPIAAQSRLTGGRFDDGGRYIGVDRDRHQFAQWATRDLPRDATVHLHRSMTPSWPLSYAMNRPHDVAATPEGASPLLVDARRCRAEELRALASSFSVRVVGPHWRVSPGPAGDLAALQYDEREPSWLERATVSGTDLVRTLHDRPDRLATWEWRHHLGLPGDPPSGEPDGPEAARVLHNAAVARGDLALAAELRAVVERQIQRRLDVSFSHGATLLGVRVDAGAATVMTLYWYATPAYAAGDVDFLVRSAVVAPPRLWPSRVDYFEKEIAPPAALRPELWRPGYLYAERVLVMRRLGTERFVGVFTARSGPAPRPLTGPERVPLVVLGG
ncbi:MAG: glycosyltransferase family 39 protein [Polyangiaceae bacterium]|nr:glycosyltransferase family 39 protein [Polyangiaceae bacterium]